MPSQKFSAYAAGLTVATETTAETQLVGIEAGDTPVAQTYPVSTGNVAGTVMARDANGSFAGEIGTFAHVETDTSTSPTFSAGGNLGTSPTVSYSGTDVAFTLTVQPGSSGQSGTTVGTVTYTKAFAKPPAVVAIPQNSIAASVSGNLHVYAISTTTGFTIYTGGGNLTNLSASSWTFLSIG